MAKQHTIKPTPERMARGDLVDQGVGEELDGTTICHESAGFYH